MSFVLLTCDGEKNILKLWSWWREANRAKRCGISNSSNSSKEQYEVKQNFTNSGELEEEIDRMLPQYSKDKSSNVTISTLFGISQVINLRWSNVGLMIFTSNLNMQSIKLISSRLRHFEET